MSVREYTICGREVQELFLVCGSLFSTLPVIFDQAPILDSVTCVSLLYNVLLACYISIQPFVLLYMITSFVCLLLTYYPLFLLTLHTSYLSWTYGAIFNINAHLMWFSYIYMVLAVIWMLMQTKTAVNFIFGFQYKAWWNDFSVDNHDHFSHYNGDVEFSSLTDTHVPEMSLLCFRLYFLYHHPHSFLITFSHTGAVLSYCWWKHLLMLLTHIKSFLQSI